MDFMIVMAAAEAEAGSQGLTQALGLSGSELLINSGAFLILVGLLAKFVFPPLIRSIDKRRETIEAGLVQAKKSQEAAEKAEKQVEALLVEARKEADEVIARGHKEAADMVAAAEDKAKQRADQIVSDARAQLGVEVTKARAALKKDTMHLVALATEKVIAEKLDAKQDAKLVEAAIAQERA